MSCEVPPIATLLSSFFNIIPADSFVCLWLKTYCTECCGEGGGSPRAEMKRSGGGRSAALPKYRSGTWEAFSVRMGLFVCFCGFFFFLFSPFSLNVLKSLSFNNEKKTRASRFLEWQRFSLSAFSSRSLSRFCRLI